MVLLDFWATWCGPCIKKMPEVEQLYGKYHDRGFVVIGIHSARGDETAEEFVKNAKVTFPIALDNGKTHESFAIEAVPTYILVDKKGKVARSPSHNPPTTEEIERLLSE